ncbi:MAG TPA: serine/threonine-protein kinase [Polyangia bacterium]|jgi:serine/threonine protein kinase/Tfp pilus assembly protein PilF
MDELARGTCVGRYVVIDRIGQGGMGVVYRAYDPELDRPLALKLVAAVDNEAAGAKRDRLLREAQALARLQHPNVIAVHDVGTFRGLVFIAMDFVEGQTLRQWLRDKPRRRREVLDAFLAAGEGLAAAHRAGLVHRDFKPDNVIVGNDGRVRVLDFGLARDADRGDGHTSQPRPLVDSEELDVTVDDKPSAKAEVTQPRRELPLLATPVPPSQPSGGPGNLLATPLTRSDAVIGTPRFMAPEQGLGHKADARADQFSFCVALYHALYGDYPYPRTADEVIPHLHAWTLGEPPAGTTVPRWLRAVLVRGLAERPADRWGSMEALLDALRADPALKRQRLWRVGAVVAVVASLGVAAGVLHRQRVASCAGAARKLDGVWDATRRAEVRAAFKASGLPYAEAALATVERAFDDYGRAFVAMHTDACEATRVRGEQSQELLDLRMSCLDDRREAMKTLGEIFAAADPGVVAHAAEAAQSLPPLSMCADLAALRAPIPPPRDPSAARRVEEIRAQLARANALELAARYDEGLRLGRAALTQAQALKYPPIEAEAELRVGHLVGLKGDYAESARLLERAYLAALAGRHEEAAARAATDLIIAVGTRQAKYADGDRWAEVAEALAGHLSRKDELLGLLYSTRSSLREREGKYDESLADAERALAIEERVLGPEHTAVADTYYHLGSVHYFKAEYPQALDAYRRCLEIEEKLAGPDNPVLIAARVGMADVYGDSGDHERALAGYQSALKLLLSARPSDPDVPMIRNNMGGELQQLDRAKEAIVQYRLALADWRTRIGPGKETVTALSNIGEADLALGQPKEALRDFREGLDMCESTMGAAHPLCARLTGWVGESERRLGKLAEAQATLERAVAGDEKSLGGKHPQLVQPLLALGHVALARGNAAAALAPLERALAILGKEPGEGLSAPDVRFALAQALWATGDRARAVTLATQAREAYGVAGTPGKRPFGEASAWLAKHR